MAGKTDRFKQLAHKWRNNTITPQEQQEFDAWYNAFDDTILTDDTNEQPDELKERLYRSILANQNIAIRKPARIITFKRLSIAASLLACCLAGGWWLFGQHQKAQQLTAMAAIKGGGNKAVLTLANGQQVVLTNAGNGKIASQANVIINKTADGKIAYAANQSATAGPVEYNTISTPRGGQYWVTLADGSRVLLNAESSLKYPVNFTGNERLVELTGEAYFEVVHNAAQPFKVKTGGQLVEDIGTWFNINAYADEASIRTTLLQGCVKVTDAATGGSKILQPGQQASLTGDDLTTGKADVEEAVAWKNGYFMFNSEDITAIMRKVSRWYNVDVAYDGAMPADKFDGTVNRFTDVSHLLQKLELTDKVHFHIEGRRIMVSR